MKHINRIAVTLVVAALVVPAAVLAKGPGSNGNHGKSGQPHGKANPHRGAKSCDQRHRPMVGYVFGGKLQAGSTASSLNILVTRRNHFGPAKGSTQNVSTAGVNVRYNPSSPFDSSGNPIAGVDLTQYNVQVIGKVAKPKAGKCTWDNSTATVRKIVVNGPSGNTGASGPSGPTGETGPTGEHS